MNDIRQLIDEDTYYSSQKKLVDWIDEWSFKSANTATYTHKIHRYPAMFIPQLVRKIIEEYTEEGDTVLDIFNGSGSTMVECCLLNRNSIGIEINPLANLIAKVKTTALGKEALISTYEKLKEEFFHKNTKYELIDFKNVDFWFEITAKVNISKLLTLINKIKNVDERDFFKICLSEIIREVSTCKHSGFKMHRDLAKVGKEISSNDFFDKYTKTFHKNLDAINLFSFKVNKLNYSKTQIQGSATKLQNKINENSVDLILTSPPYGDSQTTVAYGQFSRLSSQCFGLTLEGLEDIGSLDNELLGGKKLNENLYNDLYSRSITIKNVADFFIAKINDNTLSKEEKRKMEVRLNDVMSFYFDLDLCLKNSAFYLKKNKHFILVTGSRVVKMIKLHTDLIIAELAEKYDLVLSAIFYRNIENKRMPIRVSATNVVGEHAPTMTRESIIVLKKT